jgi:hypothetical protein
MGKPSKADLIKALDEAGHRESALLLKNWDEYDANAEALIKGEYGDWEDHFSHDRESGAERIREEKAKKPKEFKGPKGATSVEEWKKKGGKVTVVPAKKD